MEHAHGRDHFIVGGPGLLVVASLEAAGGAVGGSDPRLGGLEGVASFSGSLLLSPSFALAAYRQRGVEAHRVHPASTGTGYRVHGRRDPCPCRAEPPDTLIRFDFYSATLIIEFKYKNLNVGTFKKIEIKSLN